MRNKVTSQTLAEMKRKAERIVCVTAYDAPSAAIASEAGVDVILVGDSVANTVLGHPTTLSVSLDAMVHHTRAVRATIGTPMLVADLPFGSYNVSTEQAVQSAIILMQAGAEAVKLEGDYPEAIEAMARAGIPCWGHVGFTPQSVHKFGGFKVQGKGSQAGYVQETASRLDNAGAIAIVLELIPAQLSTEITKDLRCPTIGIGAGIHCDGEIQVWHDLLGLSTQSFRHSKRYLEARNLIRGAIESYVGEVRSKQFPTEENSF